jgi:hypothetical protein
VVPGLLKVERGVLEPMLAPEPDVYHLAIMLPSGRLIIKRKLSCAWPDILVIPPAFAASTQCGRAI